MAALSLLRLHITPKGSTGILTCSAIGLAVRLSLNLTMVNMKVLSSVKIKVENGGTLNLRDSSIYGQIEVENGGTISVNHDDYSGKFLTGTSINGQLILNDGATIRNSMIYSNTNFLPNGTQARHNTSPVVVTNGNVKVEEIGRASCRERV